jgi:hypothetical protein
VAVQALGRNIIDVPLGQPTFGDRRYAPMDFDEKYFRPIPSVGNEKLVSFVDGGSAKIASAPNFAIGLTRVYFALFKEEKRAEAKRIPQRLDFYTICYAAMKRGQIVYKTELIPAKEEWERFLPNSEDLEFSSFDKTIMAGLQRASIDRVLDVARMFAEWRFTDFIINEELEPGDVLVKDGTLQTFVTRESKYANSAYLTALEKGVFFAGLSKTSTLFTDTGQPLFSVIRGLSENTELRDSSWYYYPIVSIIAPDHRAEMYAVKLHKNSEYVFRFEILKDQVAKDLNQAESVISALADNSKDVGFPGYPYGLIDADRLARVSMNEKSMHEFQFRAAASREGIWEKISQYIKSQDAHEILNKLIG